MKYKEISFFHYLIGNIFQYLELIINLLNQQYRKCLILNYWLQLTQEFEIKSIRTSSTQNWTGAAMRIQSRIDSTYMGYMQFNGIGNNYGISFGAGSTTTAPGDVGERLRIAANGAIGIGGANYGSSGQVLTSNGNAAPSWQAVGGQVSGMDKGTKSFTLTETASTVLTVNLTENKSCYVRITAFGPDADYNEGAMYQGEFMLSCNSNSNLRPGVILNENRFQAAYTDREGVLATLADPGSPSSGGNLDFLIKLQWTYFYP